jgi:hypothetical protein
MVSAMDDEFHDADVWRGQPLKYAGFAVVSIGILVLLVFGWPRMNPLYQATSVVGAPVFVLMAVRFISNLWRGRQPMLAIGPRGLFDWRVARAWIPWADVRKIVLIQKPGEAVRGLRVQVKPDFAAHFPQKLLSRIQRWSNSLTGLMGYTIAFGGLDADPAQVANALDRHYPRWRQTLASDHRP